MLLVTDRLSAYSDFEDPYLPAMPLVSMLPFAVLHGSTNISSTQNLRRMSISSRRRRVLKPLHLSA